MNTPPTEPPLLVLEDVKFRWPGAIEDHLDLGRFELAAGERVFLRGPSGCGKSTLLSLVAGVTVARAGRVLLEGQDWRALSAPQRDRRRADRIGVIFQQFNLLPWLSALDNVLLPCRFSAERARRAGEAPAQARRLLAQLGLSRDCTSHLAAHLSVGQQQRVAAARALLGRPALVLADEPTSALDEDAREAFMATLRQACDDAGSALLFVSHDRRLEPHFHRVLDLPALNRAPAAGVVA